MKILLRSLVLLLIPAAALAESAVRDTLTLYGGPGTLEGKFQTADALPDSQGWIGVDDTVPPLGDEWLVSQYNAGNLDPAVEGNHAWMCAAEFPACDEPDPAWGYGNDWNTAIGTSRTVDPSLAATVHLTGVLNLDLEPGYDFLRVEALTDGGVIRLAELEGKYLAHELGVTHTWAPGDFVGDGGDEIALRLVVFTDSGWSDEDCSYWSAGAAQVDNLTTEITQDGGPTYAAQTETCEPGDPSYWGPVAAVSGPGCFAQLWTGLDDMDPDQDNPSPQWAFLNDGEIVPELDPTLCWTRCYADSLSIYWRYPEPWSNSILSPALDLPTAWAGELLLSFDAYSDVAECYPTYVCCAMLWSPDESGNDSWTESWYPFLLWGASPAYNRWSIPFGNDLVPTSARRVRMKIQLDAPRIGLCWGPMDSPAPYFDNVRLQLLGPYPADVPPEPTFLCDAAPNPFNPAVTLRWELPRTDDVEIRILDLRGREVRTLRTGPAPAGSGQVEWRGRDDGGRNVAAGVYLCNVRTSDQERWLKLTLLK